MYTMNMTSTPDFPLFRCIAEGSKKAEGRIASEYVRSFKVREELLLKSSEEYVVCKISYINFYKSFEDMLIAEGFKNMIPFAKSFEEAVNIYKNFPGSERVVTMGCCAIGVKYLGGEFLS